MTTIKETSGTHEKSIVFNRVMYGAFVLLSLFFLAKGDASAAMSNLGIALIFDPLIRK